MISDKVRKILQDDGKLPAFAWPGGYQLYYVDDQGHVLCPDCANRHEEYSGTITGYDANYEDALLQCNDCDAWIDPSYLSDEEAAQARRNAVLEGQSVLCAAYGAHLAERIRRSSTHP